MSVFVIAEAGVNHNGDLETAFKLIDAAAEAGADAIKFQTFNAQTLEPPGERRDVLKALELSSSAHIVLKVRAWKRGLEFISTPFDVESLWFLARTIGVNKLKIASGFLGNYEFLDAARESGCDLIVSTGMSYLTEVRTAWKRLGKGTFLHCVSGYPAPMTEANLNAMIAMRRVLGCEVGLSDHTEGIACPIAATAMGATVIEKHLTLDRSMEGPDHKASLEPLWFAAMVRGIRCVQAAMGDGVKRPQPCETEAMRIAAERKAWRGRRAA